MRSALLTVLIACTSLCTLAQQVRPLEQRLTNESNIFSTVSSVGTFGNAFRGVYVTNGWPSCQFPRRSNIEHVFQGGLWVGALKGPNQEFNVATGAFDASAGYAAGAANFEFSALSGLRERSSLISKGGLYDPAAISHQDYVSTFTDTSRFVPGTSRLQQASNAGQSVPYNPLGIRVESRVYNWNFAFSNFFLVLDYTITNIDSVAFDSVYVGIWADPVVRNVAVTNPGGTPFFSQGGTGYMEDLHTGYEFDANGDTMTTRSYFAIKYLGGTDNQGFRHEPIVSPYPLNDRFRVNFNSWNFNSPDPQFFRPDSEQDRYLKMRNGLNYQSNWTDVLKPTLKQPFNRSLFVAAGPYARIEPGQSITVSYAIICARQVNDGRPIQADTDRQRLNLINNARWVQSAYAGNDKDYDNIPDDGSAEVRRFILPSPPDLPATRFEVGDNKIEVYWDDRAERSVDPISQRQDFEGYRLYLSRLGFDTQNQVDIDSSLQAVGQWDLPANGLFFDNGFNSIRLPQPVTFPGDTNSYVYRYTIDNIQNGWQHVVALSAFDQGDSVNNLGSLETNPTSNLVRAFPGTRPNGDVKNTKPFAYPNPYYGDAAWEGLASSNAQDKRLMFANLPARCTIRIFTASGDLVDVIEHNQAYNGSDTRWFTTFSEPGNAQFSGGEHAWDLLSQNTQIIARGLYLFSVEDLDSGEVSRGQFTIIK